MDAARGGAEQVERAQIEEPADSTAVEPKHKRLGKKKKAPLPSFLPDYVEPPSGMVEAIRDELEEVAATPVGLAGTLSEPRVDRNARAALLRDAKQAAPGAPVPMLLRRAVTTVPAPRGAIISPQVLAPRRIHSEPAHLSWRTFSDSSLTHRASIVCEQVPWRVAEEALRASPSGGVLHLPSLLHYPSSAPLMPLVLSERIDDQSVDRLQTLGLLPHMARLCAVARHPVEPKSALFFGWPELGTFADENATGPWFARHPWQTLLTVLNGVAVGLCALHGEGEAHGAVTPAAVGIRHDGGAWLLPCGSLHVRPSSGSATLGEKALARDADLRGLGRLLHELGSAGASAPPAVSVALLELAPKCEALELTMHEVAAKLADVLRMSVLDSSAAPAVGDLPPATQRWSRLRVLLTAASAFTESAAKRALCLICLEEVSTRRGLACPEGHLICSACLQGYICSLAGSARLRSSNGALGCLGAHQQPFSFCRSMVEPLLFGDALRLYLETTETTESTETAETPGQREVQWTPESLQPELHEALNLSCPTCRVFCDPDPAGCIAMKCSSCDVAFCWLCFQPCGHNAHPHCHEVHGGFFPSRSDVYEWHRRLLWLQVDAVLQRSFGGRRPPEREEALRLCERNLADSEIGLWPFPTVVPSVGGMLGVAAHVQAAQFGRIDELRALLDETPELIDQANDRSMTALMAAAHGGHTAVVTMLLERGADVTRRDDRGVSALEYAIREDRQEVVLAILDETPELIDQADDRGMTALMAAAHGGHAAVVAVLLERGADVTSRDGHGVSALEYAIREDRQEVALAILDHAGPEVNAVGPRGGTALLVACQFRREAMARALLDRGAKVDALKNRLDIESARMLAKIGTEKGIMLFGIKRDQKEANFPYQGLGPDDAILLATELVTGGLTSIDLSHNQLCGIWTDDEGYQQGIYTAEGITAIADALGVNGTLTCLNISNNLIGDNGVKPICEALKQHSSLKVLDLNARHYSRGTIGPQGAQYLADMPIVNGALTKLSLASNKLEEAGTKAICKALEQNKTLKELDISGNRFGNKDSNIGASAGAKHVAKMLGVNGALTKIE
jgi:hypothetical protein